MVGEVTTGFLIKVIDKFSKPLANAEKSIKRIKVVSSDFTKTLKTETKVERDLALSLRQKDKLLIDGLGAKAREQVMEKLGLKAEETMLVAEEKANKIANEARKAEELRIISLNKRQFIYRKIVKGIVLTAIAAAAANERFADMRLQLEAVTGSAKKAQEIFDRLLKFSEKTPVSTMDIVKADTALIAFTGSQKKAEKITKQLATVSGAYTDNLDTLVKAYERVSQKGRFGQAELKTLSPRAYGAVYAEMRKIAKEHNRNMKDFDENMRKGKMHSEWYIDAMERVANKNGAAYKMLQKRNQTFMSSLKEFGTISASYLNDLWKMFAGNVTIGQSFHKLNNALISIEPVFEKITLAIHSVIAAYISLIKFSNKYVMKGIELPFKAIGAAVGAIKSPTSLPVLGGYGASPNLTKIFSGLPTQTQPIKHNITITVDDPKGHVKHVAAKSEDRRTEFNLGTNMMHVLG